MTTDETYQETVGRKKGRRLWRATPGTIAYERGDGETGSVSWSDVERLHLTPAHQGQQQIVFRVANAKNLTVKGLFKKEGDAERFSAFAEAACARLGAVRPDAPVLVGMSPGVHRAYVGFLVLLGLGAAALPFIPTHVPFSTVMFPYIGICVGVLVLSVFAARSAPRTSRAADGLPKPKDEAVRSEV